MNHYEYSYKDFHFFITGEVLCFQTYNTGLLTTFTPSRMLDTPSWFISQSPGISTSGNFCHFHSSCSAPLYPPAICTVPTCSLYLWSCGLKTYSSPLNEVTCTPLSCLSCAHQVLWQTEQTWSQMEWLPQSREGPEMFLNFALYIWASGKWQDLNNHSTSRVW